MEFTYIFSLTLSVSAWYLTSAQTCSDITSCSYDPQIYADAHARGDVGTLCNLLGKTVECMEVAMEDCEASGTLNQDRLMNAQRSLEMNKEQVNAFCPGSAEPSVDHGYPPQEPYPPRAIPENAKCSDIMGCMFDGQMFQAAVNEHRLTEACEMINPSVKCLHSAIKDCKELNVIDNDDIKRATQALQQSENLLAEHCGYTKESDDNTEPSQVNAETDQSDNQKESHSSLASEVDNSEGRYQTLKDDDKKEQVDVDSPLDDNNAATTNVISLMGFLWLLCLHIGNAYQH